MADNLSIIIKSYFSIEEDIKTLTKKLSELKLKKVAYTEQISDHIASSQQDHIKVGEKTIKLVKNKRKVFKRKNMEDSIKENVKDDKIQKTILNDSVEEQEANYLKIYNK